MSASAIFRFGRVEPSPLVSFRLSGRIELGLIKITTGNTELILLALVAVEPVEDFFDHLGMRRNVSRVNDGVGLSFSGVPRNLNIGL